MDAWSCAAVSVAFVGGFGLGFRMMRQRAREWREIAEKWQDAADRWRGMAKERGALLDAAASGMRIEKVSGDEGRI